MTSSLKTLAREGFTFALDAAGVVAIDPRGGTWRNDDPALARALVLVFTSNAWLEAGAEE